MHALMLLLALTVQRPDSFAAGVREYITVDTSLVALTHGLLVDGTGAAPKTDQTIVIRSGKIAAVGPAASVQVPAGARGVDMSGSTVIPGIIGMHDHLFYTAAGGRAVQMSYTGPRLYLGSGVTTIRTTGSRSPYAEINLKDAVDHGFAPGPRIHITAPYITGEAGGGSMAILNSPEAARRFVDYWSAEGATWIKAYTDIRRAELGAAIQEAHKRGIKVTGHLCSVSFQEAVVLEIVDAEHDRFLKAYRPSLLGKLSGSGRARHRQSRARHADRVGLHERQAARRLSHDADDRGERRRPEGERGARDDSVAGAASRLDDVDARRVRAVRRRPADQG